MTSFSYDKGIVRYDSASTDFIALPGSDTIRLIGLVKTDAKINGIPKIADLTFTGLLSVPLNMTPSGVIMADKAGKGIPTKVKGTQCPSVILGDINNDCNVDITDAALVQTYVRESKTNFVSTIGRAISAEVSSNQKTRMDVDKNGVIGHHDGKFLLNVLVGYTKLISSFTVQTPSLPSCDLKVIATLNNTDQTTATNTRAFAVLTYTDNTLNTELTASGMPGTVSYTLASGLNGRVFEMTKSSNGQYILTGVKPKITKNNVGVTLIIAVTTAVSGTKISSSFVKPANISGNRTSVSIASGIAIDIYDSFKPQQRANFSSRANLCNSKTVSKHLQMTFKADFSLILGKEAKFIAEFKVFFEAKYNSVSRGVIVSNITVKAGSIIVDFDVTVTQSEESGFINDVTNDVKNGMTFQFESNSMMTAQTLKVDGNEKILPPPQAKSDNRILIIIVILVVVFCLLFIVVLIYVCYRKKQKNSKKVEGFSSKDFGASNGKPIHYFLYSNTCLFISNSLILVVQNFSKCWLGW